VAHEVGQDPGRVEIDPASATGVSLMRCLLLERNQRLQEFPLPDDKLSPLNEGRARLLIGDQAIRFRHKYGERYAYRDLGEVWRTLTGLPFVYALWLIRPEVEEAKAIADSLRAARDRNLIELDEIIHEQEEFSAEFCAYYYRDCLQFGLGETEKAGLRSFGNLCVKHDLLENVVERLPLV
jgi:predicted solute-binding protein